MNENTKVRAEIASRALAGYLASPHFKFEELADYALKARVVADLLLDELRDNIRLPDIVKNPKPEHIIAPATIADDGCPF